MWDIKPSQITLEFILCWLSTAGHGTCPKELSVSPVRLNWREQIFPLQMVINWRLLRTFCCTHRPVSCSATIREVFPWRRWVQIQRLTIRQCKEQLISPRGMSSSGPPLRAQNSAEEEAEDWKNQMWMTDTKETRPSRENRTDTHMNSETVVPCAGSAEFSFLKKNRTLFSYLHRHTGWYSSVSGTEIHGVRIKYNKALPTIPRYEVNRTKD